MKNIENVEEQPRFGFGKNWKDFATHIDSSRIVSAEESLTSSLGLENLDGKTFIDVGCGSGLFSLAAHRLGAHVTSFDYDPESVDCTLQLRERFGLADSNRWSIGQGSILDLNYLNQLGTFDIVYSWGVLHHTGSMWEAIDNAYKLRAQNGHVFLSLYNDQGLKSRIWKQIKKTYCQGPVGRLVISSIFIPWYFARCTASSIVFRRNTFRRYKKNRGMSIYHDWKDWLGGYPFEVAKIEEVLDFFLKRNLYMTHLRSTAGNGCNEFVFSPPDEN